MVYLAQSDESKIEIIEAILTRGGHISVQVLNEILNVLRRKTAMPWPDIDAFLSLITSLITVHPLMIETHQLGRTLAERYTLSTYDAMIVASALEAKCGVLFSEDLQDGMVFDDRLKVVNPFKSQ